MSPLTAYQRSLPPRRTRLCRRRLRRPAAAGHEPDGHPAARRRRNRKLWGGRSHRRIARARERVGAPVAGPSQTGSASGASSWRRRSRAQPASFSSSRSLGRACRGGGRRSRRVRRVSRCLRSGRWPGSGGGRSRLRARIRPAITAAHRRRLLVRGGCRRGVVRARPGSRRRRSDTPQSGSGPDLRAPRLWRCSAACSRSTAPLC